MTLWLWCVSSVMQTMWEVEGGLQLVAFLQHTAYTACLVYIVYISFTYTTTAHQTGHPTLFTRS